MHFLSNAHGVDFQKPHKPDALPPTADSDLSTLISERLKTVGI
jgi:hypothetical protein